MTAMHPKEGPQKKILLILAVTLVVVGILLGASQFSIGPGGTGSSGPLPMAPAVKFKDLQGNDVALEQFRGKVVLLNFWATWCGPCKIEMPWFVGFHEKYGPQGLEVIGVAMDTEGKSVVEPFLANEHFELDGRPVKINYRIVLGTEAQGEQFGLFGLPTTLVINREGKIAKRFVGLVSHDLIVKEIETQLGQ